MKKLKVGNIVIVKTPSCATNPFYNKGHRLVGQIGIVIWKKDFTDPIMQGIKVLTVLGTGWSYYTGKEFIRIF